MRTVVSALLLSLLSVALAQVANYSQFIYDGAHDTKFVFSLQADRSTNDLYFHMSAPKGFQWMGVGLGNQMAGSLMLIAYPDSSGNGITLSPRIATGENEPTYTNTVQLQIQSPPTASADQNDVFQVNGVCRNCQSWNGGQNQLDFTSIAAPFIFAVGPTSPSLYSDDKSAGLTMHHFVGHFTMNMVIATVPEGGGVPPGPYNDPAYASTVTDEKQTNESGPQTHGLIMCIVFILLFPIGSLVLRVLNKVIGHAVVQGIAAVLFVIAFGIGIDVSARYNRTKDVKSGHQVIGILIFLAILTQLILGSLHHISYKKDGNKGITGTIHLYLGPAIIIFGLINGGLGLSLAGNSDTTIPYIIAIVIVALVYSLIRYFAWQRRRKNIAYNKEVARQSYQFPKFGGQRSAPPDYREGRGEWRAPHGQDVPLERYKNQDGLMQVQIGVPSAEPKGSPNMNGATRRAR